ncbi:FKBP-type peptidyl-prolyl cis-trans isomerase [Candidatus Micrarchaeota archaeon]|nr:FKBP-type peptidyl-prolyl cis-trans isomerase [Candidatus Micrarchaeota archaeon]
MRTYILMVVALLLLFGCTSPPSTIINNTFNTTNSTNFSVQKVLLPNYTVSLGDTVYVNYTLKVDGKVIDTNNETVAKTAGIYTSTRKYEPLKFVVQFNKGIIDGFVANVIGMKINETETFSVDPKRGYGIYDPTKVITVDRYYDRSMFETVPRSFLESRGINITQGAGFNTNYGLVTIQNVTQDNVTLFYLLTPGQKFTVNGVPQSVRTITDYNVTLERLLDVNKTYALPNPTTGAVTAYRVLNKTNSSITLDGNSPLANKTLVFQVTLVNAEVGSGG